MTESRPLVIVGSGPAGMAAATEAARAGLSSLLLDEAPGAGGQIYRPSPANFIARNSSHGGRDLARGNQMRDALLALSAQVEVRSRTSVISIGNGRSVQWTDGNRAGTLVAEQLILATGAYDRPMPFPGWTLPGVLTAGGTQSFIKTLGVRPGKRALVAGTGPLLLVVANQLHKSGVEVVAVLEAGKPELSVRAVLNVLGEPGLLRDAAGYLLALRRAGIPVLYNHTVFGAEGDGQVKRVSFGPVDHTSWKPLRERSRVADVDLLVVGFGFVPNSELADVAGCAMTYRSEVGGWIPLRDEHMRTRAGGIFAVGDGAGVAGVLVAVEEGRIAGITAAEDAGRIAPAEANRRRARPMARLRSLARVRSVLDELSTIRPGLLDLATPDTTVCRCECVKLAQVTAAASAGAGNLQAVKLSCRLGMGACQGRNCAPHTSLYLGRLLDKPVEQMGRVNPRPPIKPVTLGALARGELSLEQGS
jgi:NADPH-dependent 2,4-dienoyl-CoA reductase/sulfur reductase-like enzyme